jgi:glycosyltransferase involved in cell wall biosynthesis
MFSIVIPTYNRQGDLKRTLHGYLKQTRVDLIQEIILVDDGSTDGTRSMVEALNHDLPFDLVYLHQENKGPAEARNNGIRIASGDLLLITGDDIAPHQDLVKEHFAFHKNLEFSEKACVLGKTIWPPDLKVTPFMRHIQEMGLQFGYSIIPDEKDVPFNFFYTSNISLNCQFLMKAGLFDTGFPHAAWEDIELAYRLKKKGLRIVYNKNAIGYHYHSITFDSFRHRQVKSGYAAYIFYNKHPELKAFLRTDLSCRRSLLHDFNVRLAEAFCLFAERHLPMDFPRLYDFVMDRYYLRGVEQYRTEQKLG